MTTTKGPMTIERIQQRAGNDCGIAALAMACGVPYESVQHLLALGLDGINDLHIKDWLIANGWAWQEIFLNRPVRGSYEPREFWPPKPFAPSHIAMVEATMGWHYTVMDGAGEVFDPFNADRKSLTHPDYKRISSLLGLWPIGSAARVLAKGHRVEAGCEDCNRPYASGGFPDFTIPYDAWKQISTAGDDSGLLCPSCICQRLHDKGIRCEGAFTSGPIISVSEPTMSALRRVENIELAIAGRDNRWMAVRDLVDGEAEPH